MVTLIIFVFVCGSLVGWAIGTRNRSLGTSRSRGFSTTNPPVTIYGGSRMSLEFREDGRVYDKETGTEVRNEPLYDCLVRRSR